MRYLDLRLRMANALLVEVIKSAHGVDRVDQWICREWGKEGGNAHDHIITFLPGAARLDFESAEVEADESGELAGLASMDKDRVDEVVAYFSKTIAECHPLKDVPWSEDEVVMSTFRAVSARRCGGDDWCDPRSEDAAAMEEMLGRVCGEDGEVCFNRRRALLGRMIDYNLHDYHKDGCGRADPMNKNPPRGTCSAEVKGGGGERYCKMGFPKDAPVLPGQEYVSEDPHRKKLYFLSLVRNCAFTNRYNPVVPLFLQGGMDHACIPTFGGLGDYVTKLPSYVTKSGRKDTREVAMRLFAECRAAAKESTGSTIAKFCCKKIAQPEVVALEVCHHMIPLPEYECTREFVKLNKDGGRQRLLTGDALRKVIEECGLTASAAGANERGFYMMRCNCVSGKQYVCEYKEDGGWCPIAVASRYVMRADWMWAKSAGDEGRGCFQKRDIAAVVRIQPWLGFKGVGEAFEKLCRQLVEMFVNFPNGLLDDVDAVERMGATAVIDFWEAVVKCDEYSVGLGIANPPPWVVEKYKAGRAVVAKRFGPDGLGGSVGEGGAGVSVEPGLLGPGRLEGLAARAAMSAVEGIERENRDELAVLYKEWIPGMGLRDVVDRLRIHIASLPCSRVVHLRAAVMHAGLPMNEAVHCVDGILPAHTDVSYYSTLRSYFLDVLWRGGELVLPQHLKKVDYENVMRALGISGISGKKRNLVIKIGEALNGKLHGAHGSGRVGRKRKRGGGENGTGESSSSGSDEDEVRLGRERREVAWNGGHMVTEDWQEFSMNHEPIFGEGDDDDDILGDMAEMSETRALRAGKVRVNDLREVTVSEESGSAVGCGVGEWLPLGTDEIKGVLAKGDQMASRHRAQLLSGAAFDKLDFTQRQPALLLRPWLRGGGRESNVRPPRIVLMGTAGSGKTTAIEACLAECEKVSGDDLGDLRPYQCCAHQGIASGNIGYGARTICGLFGLTGEIPTGVKFDRLVQVLRHIQLLVIDEGFMVELMQLSQMSEVLDMVMRRVRGLSPSYQFPFGFGGIAVRGRGVCWVCLGGGVGSERREGRC